MVKIFENLSVNIKLFIYLIGFSSFLIIILWFLQIVFLNEFYQNTKAKELKNVSTLIEKTLDKSEPMEKVVSDYAKKYDISIEIDLLNQEKSTGLYSLERAYYYPQDTYTDLYYKLDLYLLATNNNNKYLAKNDTRIFYIKVFDLDSFNFIMLLSSPILPVKSTVDTLRGQLVFVTVILILTSLILAFVISKNISKPIISINNTAKSFLKADYKTKFDGKGYKEIKELSDTLNLARAELSKVENLRKELIANVSHDLRTPLTLISGYAEAMRDLPGENNKENAQIIIDESKRLTALVQNVLDLSKLQTGNETLNKTNYNLTKSIKNNINRFKELLKDYNFIFDYTEDIFVNADETKISQVIYNLIINAVNHSKDDKKILITQTRDDIYVIIKVIDYGIGITKDDLPYVFDRYYKSKKYYDRGGTGIGLSIVKGIVDAHSGFYGVTSEIDKGSVFWFKIHCDKG